MILSAHRLVEQREEKASLAAQSSGGIRTRACQRVGSGKTVLHIEPDDFRHLFGERAPLRIGSSHPDRGELDGTSSVLLTKRDGFGIVDGGQGGSVSGESRAVSLLHRTGHGRFECSPD
jgi:hypothetical protein